MTALLSIETVVVVLLGILVAGLLRSHAEILRALHGMGIDLDPSTRPGRSTPVSLSARPTPGRPPAEAIADVVGETSNGEMKRVAVTSVGHDTLLAFLTSGCATCRRFWDDFRAGQPEVPGGARLVVVTRGSEAESPQTVGGLAGDQVTVVMSSQAWEDYDIPAAPYFVYVSGPAGRVVGEGAASGWDQVESLLQQAVADGTTAPAGRRAHSMNGKARADGVRESRIDAELAEVGILPGDPRLYPMSGDGPLADRRPGNSRPGNLGR